MIAPIAPPSYDDTISLFENLSHFYCWYRGRRSQSQSNDTFQRLLKLASSELLSSDARSILSLELNELADCLRVSSVTLSSIGEVLHQIERKILHNNYRAELLATLTSLELRLRDCPAIAKNHRIIMTLLSRILTQPLSDLQAKLVNKHVYAYLQNPHSIKPLVETSVLLKSWFRS